MDLAMLIRRARLKMLAMKDGHALRPTAASPGSSWKRPWCTDGKTYQFDAMWVSLSDSTAKGKPDIELVDMTSRFRTIDIMEVTTKPIIFDGDTGD